MRHGRPKAEHMGTVATITPDRVRAGKGASPPGEKRPLPTSSMTLPVGCLHRPRHMVVAMLGQTADAVLLVCVWMLCGVCVDLV